MQYFEYKPNSSLKSYIDHIAFNSYLLDNKTNELCIVPDCMTELVFNFGKEYKRKAINSNEYHTVKGSHIIGVKSQPHLYKENMEMDTITIRFKPSRLSCFTKIPMKEISDRAVNAVDIFGSEIHKIEDKLLLAKDNFSKINIIQSFLSNRLYSNYKTEEAREIISSMYKNPSNTSLVNNTITKGMYYKKAERLFSDSVGISPKLAGRIIRINYAIQRKISDSSLSLIELAFIAGYYDQSHFIKDFINLSNNIPKEFFNNVSLTNIVNFNSITRQFSE